MIEKMEGEFRKKRVDLLLFLELDTQGFESIVHILDAQLALIDAIAALFTTVRDESVIANLNSF